MKWTLLDLTQNILSSLSSDEVNSISDTTESQQVAEIIRTTYTNMIGRLDLPEHNQLLQLTASGSEAQPVLMFKPEGVNRIDWIKYFDAKGTDSDEVIYVHDLDLDITVTPDSEPSPPSYGNIKMLPIDKFLEMINRFNTLEGDVETFTFTTNSVSTNAPSAFTFNFKNDKQPQYCTIIQDYYIVFDSYDASVDTTLQASKSLCSAWLTPSFEMTDNFIPNIDEKQFPLLLNEAKSLAFFELKQMPHPKADKEIDRQMSGIQKYKAVFNKPTAFEQLPNFGRR